MERLRGRERWREVDGDRPRDKERDREKRDREMRMERKRILWRKEKNHLFFESQVGRKLGPQVGEGPPGVGDLCGDSAYGLRSLLLLVMGQGLSEPQTCKDARRGGLVEARAPPSHRNVIGRLQLFGT